MILTGAPVKPIEIAVEQKKVMVSKLQDYLQEELEITLGGFDAEFLLDFLGKEMGSFYYNQGLYDAQAAVSQQVDNMTEAIYLLERG